MVKNKLVLKIFGLTIGLLALFAINTPALALSAWDPANGELNLNIQSEHIDNTGLAESHDNLYKVQDKPCSKMLFKIKAKHIGIPLYLGAEQTIEVCAYAVPGGYISVDGYFLKSGTGLAGKLKPNGGSNKQILLPIPNSSTIVEINPSENNKIRLTKDAYSNLVLTYTGSGTISYTITSIPENYISLESGTYVNAVSGSLALSKNGRWAVLENNKSSLVRINLETSAYKTIEKFTNVTFNMNHKLAISNDGKYVGAYTGTNTLFRLIDSEYCPADKCYSRDLRAYLMPKLNNYVGAYNLEFSSYELLFVSVSNINTVDNVKHRTIGWYGVSYAGYAASSGAKNYLAMGDSFAAGEGAYDYIKNTDTADNRCHQSAQAYPFLINAKLSSLSSANSVACSGAVINDIFYADQSVYNRDEKQSKSKEIKDFDNEIYQNYLPGYRTQDNFIDAHQPNVVTISIGGNDIGFSSIIKYCVINATDCYRYKEQRLALVSTVNNNFNRLTELFSDIKRRSPYNAKIYVIGYDRKDTNYKRGAAAFG